MDLQLSANLKTLVPPASAVSPAQHVATIQVVDENHNLKQVVVHVLFSPENEVIVFAPALPPGSLILAKWRDDLGIGQKVRTEPAK